MSAGWIVLIAVVAAIILIALVLMPRIRERARVKKQERELQRRRDQAAEEHRTVADRHSREAEAAEQRARIAQQEAELHQQRASAHERGLADDQLIEDDERERFAGTSSMATEDTRAADDGSREADRRPDGDGQRQAEADTGAERDRTSAYGEGRMAAREPAREQDFEEGRTDEENRGGLFGRFRRTNKDREPAARR